MKELNEIDALFESAFDGLRLTPDSSVKENIDQAIASKKKRRRFLFILFPVLFGVVGFAATLYFHPFSERTANTTGKQNEVKKVHLYSADQRPKTASNSGNYPQKRIKRKNALLRLTHSGSSEKFAPDTDYTPAEKGDLKTVYKNALLRPDQKMSAKLPDSSKKIAPGSSIHIAPTRAKDQVSEATITDKTSAQKDSSNKSELTQFTDIKPDSLKIQAITISDSMTALNAESFKCPAGKQITGNWSLAALTYWEGEKKRATDLQNEPFLNQKRETAGIHSSTFYGKIEVNRKFSPRWEVLTGLGFSSSKIVQYGYVDKIEIPIEGLGSAVPPITTLPDTVHSTEVQSFRVNSIVLPIGFGYSLPLGHQMRVRFSAGAEFTYGQFSRKTLSTNLSTPDLRPFGCSIWVRPELYYSFGKTELFGFGTFNQALSHQLKWDFETRRNPAFGGGIGLRIQL